MTDAVFTWDASSNNRFMLSRQGSLAINAISITRKAERLERERGQGQEPEEGLSMAENIWLAPAAAGPEGRLAVEHVMNVYVIWKFAANREGAQQFLVDYVNESDTAFRKSLCYNFPCFRAAAPGLEAHLAKEHDKYRILGKRDAEKEPEHLTWTKNVGYPGYANAAIDEIFNTWVIPEMFAEAASGRLTPEQAQDVAARKVKWIFEKWQDA